MPVLLLLSYLDRVSRNGEVSAPTPSTQLCIGKVQVLIRGKKNVEKLSTYSFFLWAFDEDLFSLSCIYLGQANDSTNCDQHKQSKIKNKVLKKKIHYLQKLLNLKDS